MPIKFTREGYRERAEALGKQRHQFSTGGKPPTRMTRTQARMAFLFGTLFMALLLVLGQLLTPALQRRFGPLERGVGTVFAKQSYDEGTPDEQYLLGVHMEVEGGKPFEDVIAVEPTFWHQVEEGETVAVRYKVDKETGGIQLRMVLLPTDEP